MKAQLQYHSLPSHGFLSLVSLGFGQFTIMLSSYPHGLSLECTQKFSTLLSQKWAYNVFITFRLFIFIYHFISFFFFFFEIALQLEYIVAFFSKSMKSLSFWALAYNKETQDQGSSYWLCRILDAEFIAYLLPQAQSLLFQKGFLIWAYDSNQVMVL